MSRSALARRAGSSGSTAAAPSPTSSRARPDGALVTHKLLSDNPEQYRDAAIAGIRQLLGVAAGAPIPAEQHRGGEDGHHGRHQRAAGAQGRAAPRSSSRGASATSCASATRTGRASSTATSCCPSCSTSAWSRSTSASARAARWSRRSTRRARGATSQAALAAGIRAVRDRLHARLPLSRRTSARWRSWRARSGFTQVSRLARGEPADEARLARATPPSSTPTCRRSCGATWSRWRRELPGARLMFMQSNGGLTDAHRFQGKDAILSGPGGRHRRHGAHRRTRRASTR